MSDIPKISISPDDCALLFPPNRVDDTVEQAAFRLTRFLRHNRQRLISYEAPLIRREIASWCELAAKKLPRDQVDADDVYQLVFKAWDSAAYPLGIDPLAEAVATADADETFPTPPENYGHCHARLYRIVHHLNLSAVRRQSSVWWAGTHALAKLTGIRQNIVHRFFERMENEKRITRQRDGNTNKATRYEVFLPPSEV